jgi:ferritin
MKPEMQKAFNDQINEELFSSYLYAAMVNYFEQQNLKGMASWMRVQVQEELLHASKFFAYVLERDGAVELKAIAAPKASWKSPLEAWKAALAHEQHITECISELHGKAVKHKDPASTIFLEWFVTEQVEEESNARDIVAQLAMVQGAPGGLYMLDRELGSRPAPAAGGAPSAT